MSLRPEHYYFGSALLLMMLGMALAATFAPTMGRWMTVTGLVAAWLPALYALIFIALPSWRRRDR